VNQVHPLATPMNRHGLIEFFKILKALSRVRIDEPLILDKTRKVLGVTVLNLGKPLQYTRATTRLFSNKIISKWNLLDQRTVDAPSLNAFKNCLSRINDNRMGFYMD